MIAHLAFQLRPRHERGDRVDDDDVDGARAHQHFDDLQSLLAAVGLRYEKVVDVDAQLFRVFGVEGMFGVHERRQPADFLRFGDHVKGNRRLA
jgi:hypothetical protein